MDKDHADPLVRCGCVHSHERGTGLLCRAWAPLTVRALVVVKVAGDCEELEIHDVQGQVEVCVSLTADGPVVHLRGGRLELDAVDTIAVRCRRFEVATSETTELNSAGDLQIKGRELKVKTSDDIHLNGKVIRLNC